MNTTQFSGVHTALVTPMRGGELARDDLESLVNTQIEGGINGIVAVGTTGESPTLSHEEHLEVIARAVRVAHGRVPITAGTGSNATSEAIGLVREADKAGADAHLQVAPYYNKPSQEGLFRHFSAIAAETERPVILYSIPGRCGIEIGIETLARLHEKHPHIIGIKEAGGSTDRVAQIRQQLGPCFLILSGDDSMTLPFLCMGAHGVISVASNLVVDDLEKMVAQAGAGNLSDAGEIARRYYPLFRDLFLEPNPVPIKHALKRAGLISSEEVRLPLCPMAEATRTRLDQTLQSLDLIEG